MLPPAPVTVVVPPVPAPVVIAAPPPPAPVVVAAPPPPAPVVVAVPIPRSAFPYPVFYATNRSAQVDVQSSSTPYKDDGKVAGMTYGQAVVNIPADFVQYLNRDLLTDFRQVFHLEDTVEERVDVKFVNPNLAEDIFWHLASVEINADRLADYTDTHDALVYIHGFNNSFEDALKRAGIVGYLSGMPVTFAFSWPSYHAAEDYEGDRDAVMLSADDLAQFLIKVQEKTKAQRVHIIAHSMGNFGLMQAVFRPAMQKAINKSDGKLRFGEIILAAADVDVELFRRDYRQLTAIADHVSIYVSTRDNAVNTSEIIAARRPRVGTYSANSPLVFSGVDTIDASDVDKNDWAGFGHDYLDTSLPVIADLTVLLWCPNPTSMDPPCIAPSSKFKLARMLKTTGTTGYYKLTPSSASSSSASPSK